MPGARPEEERRRLSSLAVWAGVSRRAEPLQGPVAVLSAHLDDGIFSLGAALACASRRGVDTTVVTVLAGDPSSTVTAGPWDRRAGFATAGEAARERRAEDARACALVGARPVWLPFSDHQYVRGASDADILAALDEALGDAESVLVPGFPLEHEDHVWLRALVDREGLSGRRIGAYVEQPYTGLWPTPQRDRREPGWPRLAASLRDRLAKVRACRAYHSQLGLFGRRAVLHLTRYEAMRGGEAVSWLLEAGGTSDAS